MVDYAIIKYDNVKNYLLSNPNGFWILPDGTVLCLHNPQSHGEVAAHYEPLIWERINKEHDEGKYETKCDFAACDLGWFRLNLNDFNSDVNCGWNHPPTSKQLESLVLVLDAIDSDKDADYWWDTGTGSQNTMLKAYKDNNKRV